MGWKVAHACVRGSSHHRSGLPNQDAAHCIVTSGPQGSVAVAVVSDGHGSPRHFRSQIGSSLAVSTVAGTLQAFLREPPAGNGNAPFVPEQVHELERRIVSVWLAAIYSHLGANPFSQQELANLERQDGSEARAEVESVPELAYGATLLAAGATDQLVLYLQLGDGEILSVGANGTTTRPLPPDDRLIGNQTTSLCQQEAWKDFRSAWVTAPALPALVLLSTDGYVNSFRSDEDFLKIGQDYLEIVHQQGIAWLAEELPSILTEATQQGSGDDITLAILQDDHSQAGAGKTPRPLMTAASKSALIEQLKARPSSQQQKLQELAMRVDQTRKENRRLRQTLLLVLAAAIAVPVAIFHNRFFPHPPAPAPLVVEWTLTLNGKDISLKKASIIQTRFIHPEANAGQPLHAYAQVDSKANNGPLFLVNDSTDVWTLTNGSRVGPGGEVALGEEPVTITFAKGISGTLAPASTAPSQ